MSLRGNISKTSASVTSGFQTRENWWKHEAAGRVLLLFSSVWNSDETRSTSFGNYFSNKRKLVSIIIWISFLNSTITFETWNIHEPKKKMCMMCMVLSPNCCAVTIFEYSTTEVMLPSCLSVPSEHVASQSKWQSADLDLVKLAKKRKSVWPALFRGT